MVASIARRVQSAGAAEDQELVLPDQSAIAPPTLGEVSRCELNFITKRLCERPPAPIEAEDNEEFATDEKPRTPDEEMLIYHKAGLKVASQTAHTLRNLFYAAWVIIALLAVLLFHH